MECKIERDSSEEIEQINNENIEGKEIYIYFYTYES